MSYISIIVPISRPSGVELVCKQLKKIVQRSSTNFYELIIGIDNAQINRFNVDMEIRKLELPFRNVHVFQTGRKPPGRYNVPERRNRIAQTLNEMKSYLGASQFVFGFEDDTILPKHAIDHLIQGYQNFTGQVGLISGVQVGRWGVPYLGLWQVDNIHEPHRFTSLPFDMRQTLIDASGFYCFLTPASLFKEIEHKWYEPTGPDVNYGLELSRRGYTNLVDWGLLCGHVTPDGILWPAPTAQVVGLCEQDGKWNDKVLGT